jgi:glycosyltransferase involved in cell wall biosynthesis
MKVCFVVSQLFAYGKLGGFGSATRTLGKALAERGIEVWAVVPRRAGQPASETIDGIHVLTYSPYNWRESKARFQQCACHIYHSEEPTMGTVFAQEAVPGAIHLVTAQDPRDRSAWWVEFKHLPWGRRLTFPFWAAHEVHPRVFKAVRRAAGVYAQAHCAREKARRLYGLAYTPGFLPNGVTLPDYAPEKAGEPLVVFVGRWDRRKRIERFFALAEHFPSVHFIAIGRAHDGDYDAALRKRYGKLPNLELPGFVDQFKDGGLAKYLDPAWILCNPAARECLPVAYLEAAAHRCAILSYANPDGFASSFGHHAADEDFAAGLKFLLEHDRWRERGEAGYAYVAEHHAIDRAVEAHLAVYERHLSEREGS